MSEKLRLLDEDELLNITGGVQGMPNFDDVCLQYKYESECLADTRCQVGSKSYSELQITCVPKE